MMLLCFKYIQKSYLKLLNFNKDVELSQKENTFSTFLSYFVCNIGSIFKTACEPWHEFNGKLVLHHMWSHQYGNRSNTVC